MKATYKNNFENINFDKNVIKCVKINTQSYNYISKYFIVYIIL